MPWAADNVLSTDPINGGIEITEQQYQLGIAAMAAGRVVVIDGGQLSIVDLPPPEVAEPDPVVLTMISKDAIWRRATDEEAELMEGALQSQSVRLRRIYEGATFISTTDELYGVLEAALVQLFGAERAAELLGPTG